MNQMHKDTSASPRGKLRIFLGAARGVGKTYAMLEAGQAKARNGVDVVAGWVDTHDRPEVDLLLQAVPVIPPRTTESHGTLLAELDLDSILARRPVLVLIDDLAHTNTPGSRHPQRYLDVIELLDNGIDVYTTLNVQHIESLNDVVAQITSLREPETIPDWIFEGAEVEVVDLAPEELLQRLHEGKILVPPGDATVVKNLYRIGNLSALRELALRRTAERVDEQMRAYMDSRAIEGPWAAGERVMVCVNASPLAERLVRSAKQMATSFHAEWVAVYVETPHDLSLTTDERTHTTHALKLAQELGAQAITIPGENVAHELLRYARANNITKIVIGKTLRERWREFLRGSIADQVIRQSGDINVFVVTSEGEQPTSRRGLFNARYGRLRGYALSLSALAVATAIGLVVRPYLAPTNIALVYLLAVVLSATSWGLGPSIFASMLAVLTFDILFVPPYGTLAVHDPQYILTFGIFLLVGIIISELGARVRAEVDAARQREQQTAALYALNQKMAFAKDITASLDAAIKQIVDAFDAEAVVLLPGTTGVLEPYPKVELNETEKQAARWTLEQGQPTGHGNPSFPEAGLTYLPLRTAQGVFGVLGLRSKAANTSLSSGDRGKLLETFAGQMAIALEHDRLRKKAEQARLMEAADRFRNALLLSVSHDLRTPLASILGSATSLRDPTAQLDEHMRADLLLTIEEEAERLNRLVGNLLQMTRLESGALQPQRDWHSVEEVVGAALARVHTNRHEVQLHLEPNLPLISFDFVLIEQVLMNLLNNAIKYSAPGGGIEIAAQLDAGTLQMRVADRGVGISEGDLERVFEKFFRVPGKDSVPGTGLGLSICKGIVEAHGGRIWAEARAGGGTQITFTLPGNDGLDAK